MAMAQAEAWHVNGAHVVAAGDSSAAVTSGRERRPDARDCSPRFHSFSNFHNVSESGLSACFPSPPVTHPIRRATTLPYPQNMLFQSLVSHHGPPARGRARRVYGRAVCARTDTRDWPNLRMIRSFLRPRFLFLCMCLWAVQRESTRSGVLTPSGGLECR